MRVLDTKYLFGISLGDGKPLRESGDFSEQIRLHNGNFRIRRLCPVQSGSCLPIMLVFACLLSTTVLGASHRIHTMFEEEFTEPVTVNDFLLDRRELMWIATHIGLYRFDGYTLSLIRPENIARNETMDVKALASDGHDLWIGTWNGLMRMDLATEAITTFMHDPYNPNSLSDNHVLSLFIDSQGRLWIGTRSGGINTYDPTTGMFRFYKKSKSESGPGHNRIWCIREDDHGKIWLGTSDGLNRFDPQSEKFTVFRKDPNQADSLSHARINSIYPSQSGKLWIGTQGGLCVIDPKTESIERLFYEGGKSKIGAINHVYEDPSGILWIATLGNGLHRYDVRENNLITFSTRREGISSGISSRNVRTVFQDPSGTTWVGSSNGGVDQIHYRVKKFRTLSQDKHGLSSDATWSVLDTQGYLWVGTLYGLNRIEKKSGSLTSFYHDPDTPSSLSDDIVWSLYEDNMQRLWVGTVNGLNRYDPETESFVRFIEDPDNPESMSSSDIFALLQDRFGTLWIGTKGGGLNEMVSETAFRIYRHNPEKVNSLSQNVVLVIYEDREGHLWVGTEKGLNLFDRKTKTFTRLENAQSPDKPGLRGEQIPAILQDNDGMFWIGTDEGLNRYDPENDSFSYYSRSDGLPANFIHAMIEDGQGFLWIATDKGLSRFDPSRQSFRNYGEEDGISKKLRFNTRAYYKTPSGELFFGTNAGVLHFFPAEIRDNPHIPPIVLTSFNIFDKPAVFNTVLYDVEEISLSWRGNFFSFEFAALDYAEPDKNRYAYMLEGFEKEYNQAGTRRYASYTNLSGGEYTLRLKGSNSEGVWNDEGRTIKITVTQPPWKRWWAYLLYAALGAALVLGTIRRVVVAKERQLQQKEQELERERQLAEELERIVDERTSELKDKNERILSSIRYAQNIQQAVLPPEKDIRAILPHHFLIFKPKDIVSGDFYWIHHTQEHIFIAVVDCTGHGVPGAFMSMIGNSFLNRIIKEKQARDPALILEQMHQGVINALAQGRSKRNNRDGMEVGLCLFQRDDGRVVFSGARRPLYIVRTEANPGDPKRFVEIKGDRKPVGGRQKEEYRHFTNHEVSVYPGDMLYLVSDGFADQLSPDYHKFGVSSLRDLLARIAIETLEQQQTVLTEELLRHQGTQRQVDDITLLGIRC